MDSNADSREGQGAWISAPEQAREEIKQRSLWSSRTQSGVQGSLGNMDLALWTHQAGLEIVTRYLVHEAATMKYFIAPITFLNTFPNSLPVKSDRPGIYDFF